MFFKFNKNTVKQWSDVGWTQLTNTPEDVDYITLYQSVPIINRAVNLVASNTAAIPKAWHKDGKELSKCPTVLRQFDEDFYMIINHIVQSLWIYGAAYLLPTESTLKTNKTLDTLSTGNISIAHNSDGSIAYFQFTFYSTSERLYPEECVYIWLNNPVQTNLPGTSPVKASYLSGFSLYNLDAYTQRFFKNGAIKATLLKVGSDNPLNPVPTREEVGRLQRLWDNLLSGNRNSHRNMVFSDDIEPIQIGDGLKELDYTGIVESRSRDTLAALGVPASLIFDDSSNYATMHQAYLSLYTNTILPIAKLVESELNNQYLLPTFGYHFTFNPDDLEVFQTSEYEKALKIMAIERYLTPEEIREAFGHSPLPDGYVLNDNSNDNVFHKEDSVSTVCECSECSNCSSDKEEEENDKEDNNEENDKEEDNSKVKNVKNIKLTLSPQEENFYNRLLRVLAPYLDAATRSVLSGADFQYDKLSEELQKAILPYVSDVYIDTWEFLVNQTGIPIPVEVISTNASEWARRHTYDLIKDLNATTQKVVQNVIAQYHDTEGMTRKEVEKALSVAFNETRASAIAVTETTRAAAQSTNNIQEYYKEKLGLIYEKRWNTNTDELVCPICEPMNGKLESEITIDIPAHPNCRCFWTLELIRKEEREDDNTDTSN